MQSLYYVISYYLIILLQLKETTLVNSAVMRRKLLIIHLLFILALQPVAQAISPTIAPVETGQTSHELTIMDCGQMDPNHCVDFETCASGGHTSCDSKTKSTLLLPALTEHAVSRIYNSYPPGQYLSHHAELLIRPPRNA